jgi:hypothetical protein
MSASRLTVTDLEWAVHFLRRTVVLGVDDQERLIATVEALEAEIARRRRKHD